MRFLVMVLFEMAIIVMASFSLKNPKRAFAKAL